MLLSGLLLSLCFLKLVTAVPLAYNNTLEHAVTVKNCGKSLYPPSSPDRIVGGKNAKLGQFPWMVSLQEEDSFYFDHTCGAAILNEYWIVTAAHCFEYKSPQKYIVLVGLHKLSEYDHKNARIHEVSKIIIHEDYHDDDTFRNDIALVRTRTPINIAGSKGYVNGICLPNSKKDPTGYATVTGWGHEMTDGANSNTLKVVDVPMIPRYICDEAYEDPYDEFDAVTDTMICAGMKNKDSCQNDSGGPLIQYDKNGIATLIGIVSHGSGCGLKYYPGVYTKVASYLKWIEVNTS